MMSIARVSARPFRVRNSNIVNFHKNQHFGLGASTLSSSSSSHLITPSYNSNSIYYYFSTASDSSTTDSFSSSSTTQTLTPYERRKQNRLPLPNWFKMKLNKDPQARQNLQDTKQTLKDLGLATVCAEAKCPNLNECWSEGTATVMILGDTCTRACRFCSVKTGRKGVPVEKPEEIVNTMSEAGQDSISDLTVSDSKSTNSDTNESLSDDGLGSFSGGGGCSIPANGGSSSYKSDPSASLWNEPEKVASAVSKWKHLKYVVVTCVDRDDLIDFGALHIAKTVKLIKEKSRMIDTESENNVNGSNQNLLMPNSTVPSHISQTSTDWNLVKSLSDHDAPREPGQEILVETLLGDFRGDLKLVDIALSSKMDVFAHNIETVERLNSIIRDRRAGYSQSMKVLEHAAKKGFLTKTSIMLGLGETDEEVIQTMKDLRSIGVRALTLGQYLQPTKGHARTQRFVTPERFEELGEMAKGELGFDMVASGPMVRSSYRAGELFLTQLLQKERREKEMLENSSGSSHGKSKNLIIEEMVKSGNAKTESGSSKVEI